MNIEDGIKISYETFRLEQMIKSIAIRIQKDYLKLDNGIPIHVRSDIYSSIRDLIFTIYAVVPTHRQTKSIIVCLPKTWKDHFKTKHQYKWWMKRWLRKHPIQMETIDYKIDKIISFPELIIPEFLNQEKIVYEYLVRKK